MKTPLRHDINHQVPEAAAAAGKVRSSVDAYGPGGFEQRTALAELVRRSPRSSRRFSSGNSRPCFAQNGVLMRWMCIFSRPVRCCAGGADTDRNVSRTAPRAAASRPVAGNGSTHERRGERPISPTVNGAGSAVLGTLSGRLLRKCLGHGVAELMSWRLMPDRLRHALRKRDPRSDTGSDASNSLRSE